MDAFSFEESLLFTTIRIQTLSAEGTITGVGTGFFLVHEIDGLGAKAYLISNKHVIADSDSIKLEFIKRKDNSDAFEPDWTHNNIPLYRQSKYASMHPDPDIDIAAIDMSGFLESNKDKIFLKCLRSTSLATCLEEELHVTQSVYFIGYPDNRYDEVNNLPLIRTAILASHPSIDFNGRKQFIIDGQVFPGSSGSPVVMNLGSELWKSGRMPGERRGMLLLGVVSMTMIRNNRLEYLQTDFPKNAQTQEVLGLGIVFKSTAIRELLDIISKKFQTGDYDGVAMTAFEE